MNDKQRAELIRQLVGGRHHHYRCGVCLGSFSSGAPLNFCPDGCPVPVAEDRDLAARYYSDLIDEVLAWGS